MGDVIRWGLCSLFALAVFGGTTWLLTGVLSSVAVFLVSAVVALIAMVASVVWVSFKWGTKP